LLARLLLVILQMDSMITERVDASKKCSITPFFSGGFGEEKLQLPFQLADISVESVEGLLRSEHFSLWSQSNYSSKRMIESFERAKVALVHRFVWIRNGQR
jgi:hypothetical protein